MARRGRVDRLNDASGSPFAGGANLRISGNGLNHPPQLEGSMYAAVGPIAGSASQTIHFTATPVKVDCVAPHRSFPPPRGRPRPQPKRVPA